MNDEFEESLKHTSYKCKIISRTWKEETVEIFEAGLRLGEKRGMRKAADMLPKLWPDVQGQSKWLAEQIRQAAEGEG